MPDFHKASEQSGLTLGQRQPAVFRERLCPTSRHFPIEFEMCKPFGFVGSSVLREIMSHFETFSVWFGVRGVRTLWSVVGFLHFAAVCVFIRTVLNG